MAFLGVVSMVMMIGLFPLQFEAQQRYANTKQVGCDRFLNSTLGWVCNAAASCSSFLTLRSTPTYNSPVTIAYLLTADASEIAAANNISDMDSFFPGTLVIVPVNCSCSGDGYYYQHNASYALKSQGESYFTIANDTYQSLSTCQSLMVQNPYKYPDQLRLGIKLTVPLRCACPTPAQTSAGFTYLLTYLVSWGDNLATIAADFAGAGADVQAIRDANMLAYPNTMIFFFTPLLVPLKTQPTAQNINTAPELPPPPPAAGGSYKWIFICVGIGGAVLIILSSIPLVWLSRRHCRRRPSPEAEESGEAPLRAGIRSAMETLSIYKVEELEKATNSFAESNRMNGSWSVYRGWFKGEEAVVKVTKGDVSREIETLRQMKHSRIVRLSGFCLHQATTYLVYEYAPNGSLKEWLRSKSGLALLNWEQRLQIAYDVADALNYLHNFTEPPYIHNNLTSTNILLDSNMRAKVANFGLARAMRLDEMSDNVMTMHLVGAQGYMAPEFIEKGLLSTKLDVFAFGVVMLELLSGREPISSGGGGDDGKELVALSNSIGGIVLNLRERLPRFMDPRLGEKYPMEVACSMAQLANSCVSHNVDSRPSLSRLLLALSSLRSHSLDSWDPTRDVSTYISFSE